MADTIDESRASHKVRLSALRDGWISAENARVEAYRAFMDANKNSPLRIELDARPERNTPRWSAIGKSFAQPPLLLQKFNLCFF